jgi:HJR/Mrr/RecB family endonuclease
MSVASHDAIIIRHLRAAVTFNRFLLSQGTIFWDCLKELALQSGTPFEYEDASRIPAGLQGVAQELGPLMRLRLSSPRASDMSPQARELLKRHEPLVRTFLEIAERNVSTLDEYGDENWKALDTELRRIIEKLAQRDGLPSDSVAVVLDGSLDEEQRQLLIDRAAIRDHSLAGLVLWQARKLLINDFLGFHEEVRDRADPASYLDEMTGVEFETFIARTLSEHGFSNVRGTPASGDQGADVLAEKGGRRLVVQAKRYRGSVGNRAVQEVIAALAYYGADEAWVVTNSEFTASARALAQRARVVLVGGARLSSLGAFLNTWPVPAKRRVGV